MINFPTEQSIRGSYLAQRKLAQLHRWITLQLDPRADASDLATASLTSTLQGQPCSTTDLSAAVQKHHITHLACDDQTWPNPYMPAPLTVTQDKPSTLAARFENTELPLLSEVALSNSSPVDASAQPSAIAHRILALKHRWHAIVEAPQKTPSALQELIAPSFDMQWGYGGLSGFSELSAWLTKSAASMDAARHDIAAFAWEPTGRSTFQAQFDFVWYGYSLELEPMHAESRHTWQIEDDPQERYPRIRDMSVEFLIPFHTVSGANHD